METIIILNQKAQSMTFLANIANFVLYSKEETEPSDIEERNYYFSGGARTGKLRWGHSGEDDFERRGKLEDQLISVPQQPMVLLCAFG